MRAHRLSAVILVSLSCIVLTASCLQGPTAGPDTAPPPSTSTTAPPASEPAEPTGEAPQASGRMPFGSKDFPFVTEVEDDGKDPAGGWQITQFAVHFVEAQGLTEIYEWDCPIEVGMPIRSKQIGRITPSRAALWTAEVINVALPEQRASRDDWTGLGVVFCRELNERMKAMFKAQYPGCGATVTRWLR